MLLGSPLYQLEMTSLIRSEVYSVRFRASKTNSILNRWNLDQSLFKYGQVQLHSSYQSSYILDTIFLDLCTHLHYIYTSCLECTQCLCHFFLKRNLIRWSIQRHGYLIGADALWLYKSVLSDLINWRWTFELSYKRHRTNSIRLHNSKHCRDEYRVSKIRNQNLPYRHCVMSFMRKEKKFIRACQI